MNKRLDEIEILIKNSVISEAAYAAWKDNAVTQRFMLELEQDFLDTQRNISSVLRDSIEKIAIECIRNAEHCEVLEEIMEWKPYELQKQE